VRESREAKNENSSVFISKLESNKKKQPICDSVKVRQVGFSLAVSGG